MLISERIRCYRKKCGLSQEELGEKLLVSRQTISLWEQGQTLPTIDNLVRLKDIFHVSADELLGVEKEREAPAQTVQIPGGSDAAEPGAVAQPAAEGQDEEKPCESCLFSYTQEDCGAIYKSLFGNVAKKLILPFVCCAFLFALAFTTDIPAWGGGFLIGFAACFLTIAFAAIFRYLSLRKRAAAQLQETEVALEVYADSLSVTLRKEGEYRLQKKYSLSAVRKLRNTNDFLLMQWQDEQLIIKKKALKSDSVLYACSGADAPNAAAPANKARCLSLLFCLGSIAAFFFAIFLVLGISDPPTKFLQNAWILFLFIPIPIASVVLGFYWKAKKQVYKKNIIIGIVITLLLCIYGSFTFVFSGMYDYSDKPVARVEQLTGIQLPQYRQIVTTDWTKFQQTSDTGYIYYSSEVTFSAENAPDFEELSAELWLHTVPNDILGLTVLHSSTMQLYDRFLFYNIDTETFNLPPADEGSYRMLNLLYDSETHKLRIMEYMIFYTV